MSLLSAADATIIQKGEIEDLFVNQSTQQK